jgi:hypothetical protein
LQDLTWPPTQKNQFERGWVVDISSGYPDC